MNENIKLLEKKLAEIQRKGWIQSKRKGTTGIGYTFETMIGKEEDQLCIPDFYGIEIKTIRKKSQKKIHLFTMSPDGDFLYPMERVLKLLGYPDKYNKEYNRIFTTVSGKNYKKLGYYKIIKLIVNRKDKKIELIAYNIYGEKIPLDTSWSFSSIEERMKIKLSHLAIIQADNKIINNQEFFKYEKMKIYKYKGIETFLELIEKGIIEITIKATTYKQGNKKGKIHNRGGDFSILEKDIEKLYECIYE